MIETLIAIGIAAALAGIAAAVKFGSFEPLLVAGAWCAGAGLAFGIPTALVYHVRLYRALKPRGELPGNWLFRPIELHAKLRADEYRGVVTWAWAGGAGWAVAMLGCVLAFLALLVVNR